jgi:hypothetical protein
MSRHRPSSDPRRIVRFLTLIGLVVGALAIAGSVAATPGQGPDRGDGDTVVCPQDANGERCDYHEIQAAVDAADDGDTVFITAGEYHPNSSITVSNTSGLTIRGAGRDATFIYGPDYAGDGEHGHKDGRSNGTHAAGPSSTAGTMYHNDSAHNPFTDPEGYAEYVANYPEEWAYDHANHPVERTTTHAGQARRFATNESDNESDGGHHDDEYDAFSITADGVTVSDLHVEGFNGNGVYYSGVRGFHVTRVDTVDNGAYGIYAIRSTMGTFEDSYAAGHYDSGFYLGEVTRCDCVIRNVTAVENLIGYSGTGAGFITIEDSTWRDNAAGVVPNVLPNEPSPQIHLEVRNNRIVDNNNRTAYRQWHFAGSLHAPVGSGVIIGGGSYNTVAGNVIRNHSRAGVLITYMATQPSGNAVIGNEFAENDLEIWWDGGGANNCFSDNEVDKAELEYDAGTYWNQRGELPECTDDDYATPPDPEQLAEIATPVLFGCELDQAPTHEHCHVEEPEPHVHPPGTPGEASASAMFGDEPGDHLESVRASIAD